MSTEEYGHLFYDGDGVIKNREEAYVWYRIALCAGNHNGVFQGSWHSFLNIYAALFTASTVGFCGFSSTASI